MAHMKAPYFGPVEKKMRDGDVGYKNGSVECGRKLVAGRKWSEKSSSFPNEKVFFYRSDQKAFSSVDNCLNF